MKIVVLDARSVEQDDLSFEKALSIYGDVTVYTRTKREDTIERIGLAEAIFVNKVVIDKVVMENCPNLKFVGINATGYNVVDVVEAKARGIVVCNVPAYSTNSVAQLTFALLLELCSNVGAHNKAVHSGEWVNCQDFCFATSPITELYGKTMGIVGYGNIGNAVAKIARAFGMKVLAYNRTPKENTVSLEEVLKNSDFVSLHCALSKDNEKFINAKTITLMKPTAFLLNTSRGGLIDEEALADALNSGKIAGAGLDVLSVEPPKADNPLLTAKNCLITPHIAWMSFEARQRLLTVTVENLKNFIEGKPKNVVS
ncbi:MAG: D-2-hydroxyacid dehydrogenase [Clostridia bacterium]|nr:D-2-hydroxyacid dehydrogenase [Clostridia bacterium]